jgi:thioredoxin reductase
MLYRGKDVVVAGRTPDAPEEAKYLKSIGCHVTYTAPKSRMRCRMTFRSFRRVGWKSEANRR